MLSETNFYIYSNVFLLPEECSILGLADSRLRAVRTAFSGSAVSGFVRYVGPALIVSTAYIDPGNFGTDISGGVSYAYKLLWVVWLANVMAMVLQYLSGKIGIATGLSLADLE